MGTISFKTSNAFSYENCKHASHCLFIPVILYVLQNVYVLTKLVTRGQTAHADLVSTTITFCFKKNQKPNGLWVSSHIVLIK